MVTVHNIYMSYNTIEHVLAGRNSLGISVLPFEQWSSDLLLGTRRP
jgi:hypothetical protein